MAMKLSTEQDTEDAAAVANTKDSNEDDDMVPVPVDNSILSQLVDMGFADVSTNCAWKASSIDEDSLRLPIEYTCLLCDCR